MTIKLLRQKTLDDLYSNAGSNLDRYRTGNFDDLLKARHACLKELGGGTPDCGIFQGCLRTKGYTRDDISGKITVPGQFVVSCN